MKEYIVALKKGVNYDAFWNEIENLSDDDGFVPSRRVDIADNLSALDRVTHYFLTDQEAETLRHDPRVLGVEIPAEHREDIVIRHSTVQDSLFTKTNNPVGNIVNRGLIRHSYSNNVYGLNTTTTLDYNYALDGSNVDIVIIDSGIQSDHPEFQYLGNSTSRVQTSMGNTSLLTSGSDYSGHGTHVAGIVAGKTYGWAKNAQIYPIKWLAAATDPNQGFTGQTFGNIANIIVSWTNSKSPNPSTGTANPTVVNMSLSYSANIAGYVIANVTWRGNTFYSPGYPNTQYGIIFNGNSAPIRNSVYDVYVDNMIDAGIVVCKSAGNDSQKIDVPGGTDWDNIIGLRYTGNLLPAGSIYYMRGASPMSSTQEDIIVGALDSTPYNATTDTKASYSAAGPGVDIFAAGSNIQSAMSNIHTGISNSNVATYFLDSNYNQADINGTSMSCPQIAGIVTLYLQSNPTSTPANVKSWLLDTATPNISSNIANVSGSDYGNIYSQWGGNANVAYQPIQGLTQIKTNSAEWKAISNVYVKTGSSTWTEVEYVYTKTDGTTWKQTYTAS